MFSNVVKELLIITRALQHPTPIGLSNSLQNLTWVGVVSPNCDMQSCVTSLQGAVKHDYYFVNLNY
ncbi:MAG: hypothetical protein MRERV_68c003 [Mycoplasmataceae bacterium RV_VA103A]|nr:MAG: hypothetical protein MRERV_68c003 [Mycoplasmataceae bacterium RV_VA103A]